MAKRVPVSLPAGDWLPDQPQLNNPGLVDALNLFPDAGGKYPAMLDITPAVFIQDQSSGPGALDDQVLGAALTESPTTGMRIFWAQTRHHFYCLPGEDVWQPIDAPGEAYDAFDNTTIQGLNADPTARLTPFNDEVFITRDGQFDMHVFNATPQASGSGTVGTTMSVMLNTATDGGSGKSLGASLGYYPAIAAVVKSFLVVGKLWGIRNRIAWSAVNAPTEWPQPGTNLAQQVQSDYEDLPGALGTVTAIVPSLVYADAAIVCSSGVWRMVYTGPPDIFDFYPAMSGKGSVFTNSVVILSGTIYYVTNDGFYAFNGLQLQPLGSGKVDGWFLRYADLSREWSVTGAVDINSKCVIWSFIPVASSGQYPSQMMIYNTVTGRFTHSVFNGEILFASLVGERSSSSGGITVYMPPAAIVEVWAFNQSHELCTFSGAALGTLMQTKEVNPFGEYKARVRSVRALIDGWLSQADAGEEVDDPTSYTSDAGVPTVTLNYRNRQSDIPAQVTVPLNSEGVAPFIVKARFLSVTIQTPSSSAVSTSLIEDYTAATGAVVQVEQAGDKS